LSVLDLTAHLNTAYANRDPVTLDEAVIRPYQGLNLEVIAGDVMLSEFDMAFATETGREFIIQRWFKENYKILRQRYDVVLIDSAPGMSLLNLNLMVAASHYVMPLTMEGLAFKSARLMQNSMQKLDRLNVPRPPIRLVANRIRRNQTEIRKGLEYLRQNHMDEKFETHIPDSAAFIRQGGVEGESHWFMEKEFIDKRNREAAEAIIKLSREMMQWMNLRGAARYAE
jgi:cellulose biosynthesis protein BcsQ